VGGIGRVTTVQASPDKKARPYLKNNLKQKGLEVWLKWKKKMTILQILSIK
jgi:hypothetical protein